MGETYPPAAAWGAQGASPLQPELLYICPGHFSSVTESSGHTMYTHLSHMLALWKVNVSRVTPVSGLRPFIEASSAAQTLGHAAKVSPHTARLARVFLQPREVGSHRDEHPEARPTSDGAGRAVCST